MRGYYQESRDRHHGVAIAAAVGLGGALFLGRRYLLERATQYIEHSPGISSALGNIAERGLAAGEWVGNKLASTNLFGDLERSGLTARQDILHMERVVNKTTTDRMALELSVKELRQRLSGIWSADKIETFVQQRGLVNDLLSNAKLGEEALEKHLSPGMAFRESLEREAREEGVSLTAKISAASKDLEGKTWGAKSVDIEDVRSAVKSSGITDLARESYQSWINRTSDTSRLFGVRSVTHSELFDTSIGDASRKAARLSQNLTGISEEAAGNLGVDLANGLLVGKSGKQYDLSKLLILGQRARKTILQDIGIPFSPGSTSVSLGQLFPFLERQGDRVASGYIGEGKFKYGNRLVTFDLDNIEIRPPDEKNRDVLAKVIRKDTSKPWGAVEVGDFTAIHVNREHDRQRLFAQRNYEAARRRLPAMQDMQEAAIRVLKSDASDAQKKAAKENLKYARGVIASSKGRPWATSGVPGGTVPYWDAPAAFFRKFKSRKYTPNLLTNASKAGLLTDDEAMRVATLLSQPGQSLTNKEFISALNVIDSFHTSSTSDLVSAIGDGSASSWANSWESLAPVIKEIQSPKVKAMYMRGQSLERRDLESYLNQTASFRETREAQTLFGIDTGAGRSSYTQLDVLKQELLRSRIETLPATAKVSEVGAQLLDKSGVHSAALSYSVSVSRLSGSGYKNVNEFVSQNPELQSVLKRLAPTHKGGLFGVLDLQSASDAPWEDYLERDKIMLTNAPGNSFGARMAYFFAAKMHHPFEALGVGLSDYWKTSAVKLAFGTVAFRFLPILGLIEGHKFVNRVTRDVPGLSVINPDSHRAALLSLLGRISHKVVNHQRLTQMIPGADFYTDNRTDKDQRQFEKTAGYTPVRSGRWWMFGSRESFAGSYVKYYLPSAERIARSDWQAADNVDMNSWAYWKHFGGILNPINWVDRDWWAVKHQKDRPYPQAAPMFDPDSIYGSVLNFTVGRLKKRRLFHSELIPKHLGGSLEDQESSQRPTSPYFDDTTPYRVVPIESWLQTAEHGGHTGTYVDNKKGKKRKKAPGVIKGPHERLAPGWTYYIPRRYDRRDPRSLPLRYRLNTRRALYGARPIDPNSLSFEERAYISQIQGDNQPARLWYHAKEIAGLYGFLGAQVEPTPAKRIQLADSSRATGIERKFWESEIGGLGGSEMDIIRRFIPHRNRLTEEYNPIPNQMPDFLPSKFKIGDPYCVSPDTPIEVNGNELIRADEVQIGTIIRTHTGALRPVKAVKRRKVKDGEKVYKITALTLPGMPFIVSEEHPILAKKRSDSSPYWIKAKDLESYHEVAYPIPKFGNEDITIDMADLPLPEHYIVGRERIYHSAKGSPKSYEILEYLIDNGRIDYWHDTGESIGRRGILLKEKGWSEQEYGNAARMFKNLSKVSSFPRYIHVDKDIAYMLGIWIAEGHADPVHSTVAWTLNSNEVDIVLKINTALLKILGKEAAVVKKGENGLRVVIGSRPLGIFLQSFCGSGAHNKHLPTWIVNANSEISLSIIKGVIDGDGWNFNSKGHQHTGVVSVSKNLIYQVRQYMLPLGITGSIGYIPSKDGVFILDREINSGPAYTLSVSGQQAKLIRDCFNTLSTQNIDKPTKYQRCSSDDKYIYMPVFKKEEVLCDEVIGFEVGIDDSFCVAGVATHNTKIERGEMRLPGKSYERLHGITDESKYRSRASSIGKSKEEIANGMLHKEGDGFSSEAAEEGKKLHLLLQKRWEKLGLLEAYEIPVYDKGWNVGGHVDAVLRLKTKNGKLQRTIVDIKTKNTARMEAIRKSHKPEQENVDQVQYYMHVMKIHNALLTYVNRQDPEDIIQIQVKYDARRIKFLKDKLESARALVREQIERGEAKEADLYDPITKFEILSDVGQGSQEYHKLDAWAKENYGAQNETDQWRIDQIRKRSQHREFELHPYRFVNLHKEKVKVADVISASQFRDETGRRINIAGIKTQEDTPALMKKGDKLTILSNQEGEEISAAVFKGPRNLAKTYLRAGAAEPTGDTSAEAVRSVLSGPERAIGWLAEQIGHIDSIINTKFLPVRTGLEQYERTDVYGKAHGSWSHPARDYVWPTIGSMLNKNVVSAALSGAFFGAIFGSNKQNRIKLGIIGAGAGVALSILGSVFRATGHPFIAPRVKKRRERDEYYDNLTYLKYKALAEREGAISKERESIDPDSLREGKILLTDNDRVEVEIMKQKIAYLRKIKDKSRRGRARAINELSVKLRQKEKDFIKLKMKPVGPHAQLSIAYRERMRATLRGATEEGSLQAILQSLPKPSASAIRSVVQTGSPQEKRKLYTLLPKNQKAALARFLGVDPRKAPRLKTVSEYFSKGVPDRSWGGWRPDISLRNLKVREVAEDRTADPMDYGIFPNEIERAEQESPEAYVPLPKTVVSQGAVRNEIQSILHGYGFFNVQVSVNGQDSDGENSAEVLMNVKHHREKHILRQIH